ncbi:MAG: PEGA domain-containing protein [Sandaracinaceae bacterium]|nr:PEGA domain-containing protein [Sandaracinaceae bacterium]MBK7156233.1 PEGA domain-containing protein [Sandaracinaceae bacterium]MBK8412289.1 PEGA domain-containing protein [Sandaracinaceae bacterium]
MTCLRTLSLIGALALTVVSPRSAAADTATEARFHDEQARDHFRARRFAEAIEEFLWSNRIAPNPRVGFNVALCFLQLGDLENAYSYFSEYMTSDDSAEGAEERRTEAARYLNDMRSAVALVVVSSEPAGATLYVDTEEHGAYGLSPRTLALPVGEHTLTFVASGYERVTQTVVLERGRSVEVHAVLSQIVGTVRFEAIAPTPLVLRDVREQVVLEATAPSEHRLPPGVYTVTGGNERHRVESAIVRVAAGETTRAELTLVPRPAITGEATITSNVQGALVLVDGVEAGFAPVLLPNLTLGTRTLRIEVPGHDAWEGDVDVRERERTWVTATLRESGPPRRSPAGYIVGALGAAALLSLVVTVPMAYRAHQDFHALRDQDAVGAANARARGRVLNRTSDALLGMGLGALGIGITLWFVLDDPRDHPSEASVSFRPR